MGALGLWSLLDSEGLGLAHCITGLMGKRSGSASNSTRLSELTDYVLTVLLTRTFPTNELRVLLKVLLLLHDVNGLLLGVGTMKLRAGTIRLGLVVLLRSGRSDKELISALIIYSLKGLRPVLYINLLILLLLQARILLATTMSMELFFDYVSYSQLLFEIITTQLLHWLLQAQCLLVRQRFASRLFASIIASWGPTR